jgi:cellulose synthase/poly-beta-1,6-N-acetylglucosamine synthase-like glycosyltransferase
MSLIIAAYNEEENIGRRLDNALALDYPSDKLEIIVVSDGSEDATETIVAQYLPRGVRLLALPRQGKIHALNEAVQQAGGDILVFSDANVIYQRLALRNLARNFADLHVGGVAGNTNYDVRPRSESSSHGENLYWSYDKWLKQLESLTGSIVSAHGAIYAIRRTLYRPVTDAAVTDDFAISTAVVEQGYRLVFESDALAYEVALPEANREFWRKVRLMTRGLRGLILRKALFNPSRYGFYSLVLLTHKLLRRLVPLCLLALFAISIFLSTTGGLYLVAVVGQALFYGLAGVGYLLRRGPVGQLKWFYLPFFYCMANAAALVALVKLVRGQRVELWHPQRHRDGRQFENA